MKLMLEAAVYSELDFASYNREGFGRVRDAIGVVHQARALARTPDEMAHVVHLATIASERKNAEQKVAEMNFLKMRDKAYRNLRQTKALFERSPMWGVRRLAIEQQIEHAITRFSLKAFDEVLAEVKQIAATLEGPRPVLVKSTALALAAVSAAPQADPVSASAWYERGRQMEKMGQHVPARKAYEKALEMAPAHFMAQAGLTRLNATPASPEPGATQNQQRRA